MSGDEPLPLRRNRDFVVLWSARAVSELADRTTMLAYPIVAVAVTRSAAEAGVVAMMVALGRMIFRLPAGALADRFERRSTMWVADACRAALMLAMALLVASGHASVVPLAAVALLDGALVSLFAPAERAAIRQVVPTGQLGSALAQNQARASLAAMAGPPIAGVLVGFGLSRPFLFTALLCASAAVVVRLLLSPLAPSAAASEPILTAIGRGLAFIRYDRFLRLFFLIYVPVNLAASGVVFGFIASAVGTGVPPATVGLVLTAAAVAAVAGAVTTPWLHRRMPASVLVVIALWAMAVTPVAVLVSDRPVTVAAVLSLGFFASPIADVTWNTAVSLRTPVEFQGRVASVVFLAGGAGNALGPLLVGALLAATVVPVTVAVLTLAIAASAMVASVSPTLRGITLQA